MMDLILTKQKPYQAGYYWMAENGHDNEYYEDPENYSMVEIADVGLDFLWLSDSWIGDCLVSGYLKNIHNKLWSGPIPYPRKRYGN